jgi:hypothetical protein
MSSTLIYLYKKTHNITGLQYLGKTCKDPFSYSGSGTYWLRHLKQHGNAVTTEVIFQTKCLEEFKHQAVAYSIEHNIVESSEWANLIIETGSGGYNPLSQTVAAREKRLNTITKNNKRWKLTAKGKQNHSTSALSYWESDAAVQRRKTDFIGPPKPPAHLVNNSSLVACPHCGKRANIGNANRWHFDKCKLNPIIPYNNAPST